MLKAVLFFTLLALGPVVSAFDREHIELLTKAASYTFDRICELHNPDPFFDEFVSQSGRKSRPAFCAFLRIKNGFGSC